MDKMAEHGIEKAITILKKYCTPVGYSKKNIFDVIWAIDVLRKNGLEDEIKNIPNLNSYLDI